MIKTVIETVGSSLVARQAQTVLSLILGGLPVRLRGLRLLAHHVLATAKNPLKYCQHVPLFESPRQN